MFDKKVRRHMIVRGLLVGLLGGACGSAAKLIGEAIYPPRTLGQEAPPAILAQRFAGRPLSTTEKTVATQTFHWTLGAGIGAVYGVAAEFAPIVTLGYGVAFGITVMLGTHESALPLLGLVELPTQQPLREHSSELLTHSMYGFTVELVRRGLVRRWRAKVEVAPQTRAVL